MPQSNFHGPFKRINADAPVAKLDRADCRSARQAKHILDRVEYGWVEEHPSPDGPRFEVYIATEPSPEDG
jgi:hypothetical protein